MPLDPFWQGVLIGSAVTLVVCVKLVVGAACWIGSWLWRSAERAL